MADQEYPEYVDRLLAEAEALLADEEEPDPSEAAALCFEVLALFPEHTGAAELVYRAYCDPWLIRDNRRAIERQIDEWDDRPWQQRRRLALSFRFMSRWDGFYREYDEGREEERLGPADVRAMLDEGHGQLLEDYLVGVARGAEIAWPIFQEAIRRSNNPRLTMLWVAKEYANLGYFAEAADVLADLLAQYPNDEDGRRLRAEVVWWRDNQHRIPWIPPAGKGDGRRFRRMIARHDPEFAAGDEPLFEHIPPDRSQLPPDFELPLPIPDELVEKIEAALENVPQPAEANGPVDWSYLDLLEQGDEIDSGRFPEWAQDLLADIDNPEYAAYMKEYLVSYLANPPIPPAGEDDEEWEGDRPDEED